MIDVALNHHRAGRLAEAEAIYRQILAADGGHFDALHLLGVLRHQQGRHEEAIDLLTRALARQPQSAEAHNNLGIVLQACGRSGDAIAAFRRAVERKAGYAEALFNLGSALQAERRVDEAMEPLDAAVTLAPSFVPARLALARALASRRMRAAAVEQYRAALGLDPALADAHYELALLLQKQGRHADAAAGFRDAWTLSPTFVEARWADTMERLVVITESDADQPSVDAACALELSGLAQWFEHVPEQELPRAVGSQGTFWLAYNDRRNVGVLSGYGDVCAGLMARWQDSAVGVRLAGRHAGPVRVGIVSAHIRDHSVWTAIVRGWLDHLDPGRVAVRLFHAGRVTDEQTDRAIAKAASYRQSTDLLELAENIVDSQLDVLIYPEIGMDRLTIRLASLRLAPVQAVAWGHPETSGLPTIDYFLSAACFEPPDAASRYREALVALPALGCCYTALDVEAPSLDLASIGVRSDVPLLVCPGTPYKYRPENDGVLVEIAKRTGACQLVFFHDDDFEELSAALKERLTRAFAAAGLDFDAHARFVPWLPRPAFFGLLRAADVFLDTIGFSGFNTVMQAVQCNVPIVTLEGRALRGRFGSGILRRMGMDASVATDADGYVDLAVGLATDAERRADVRARMSAARAVLFDDVGPVDALQRWLVDVAGRASTTRG